MSTYEIFRVRQEVEIRGTSLLGRIPTCLPLTSAPILSTFLQQDSYFTQAFAHTISAAWIILSSISVYFLYSSFFKAKFPGHKHATLPQWIPLSSALL